jgi:ATP-binding cassette subfamily B protein
MRPLSFRAIVRGLPRAGRVRRYFVPYVAPHWRSLAGGLVLGALVAATEVLKPWPLQVVFDHVLAPRSHPRSFFGIDFSGIPPGTLIITAALGVVLISALGGFAAYGQAVLLAGTGQRIVTRIRRDLFRHLMKLPPLFHTQRRHGDLLMRLTGDIVLVRELLVGNLLDAFSAGLTLVGTFIVMIVVEPRLTLASLAIVPGVSLASALLSGRIRRAVVRAREKEGGLASHAGEALGAIALLQAFGATGRIAERFERENRSGLRAGLKSSQLEAVLTRALDLLTSAGLGVTLALGAWSVRDGRMTPGELLVFLAYQRNLYRPIRQIARLAARTAKSSACGERIIEILEAEPAVTELPGARPCPPLAGEIRFEDVTLRYPRGDVALSGVTACVPPGATVVIRGESGAGKTTLVSLLPRLLDPTEGRVLMDGHDVRTFTLDSLRERVAMVFQESVLLGLTVRENIELGRLGASPEDLERAAERAGVLRFSCDLPHGLDTIVGERGALLSGGQRQRIALARAALRGSPILVLDEPFAHLDALNRASVVEALKESTRGRTVLVVTHDSHAGLEADFEWVLDHGRLQTGHDRRASAPRGGGDSSSRPSPATDADAAFAVSRTTPGAIG